MFNSFSSFSNKLHLEYDIKRVGRTNFNVTIGRTGAKDIIKGILLRGVEGQSGKFKEPGNGFKLLGDDVSITYVKPMVGLKNALILLKSRIAFVFYELSLH